MTYDLVRYDDAPLPAESDQPCGHEISGCKWIVFGGWYHLAAVRWEAFDSIVIRCSCAGVGRDSEGGGLSSGTVRHRGDTLVFEVLEKRTGHLLPWDEGIVRGDTLYTGFSRGGPPRVYVKR